MDLSYNRLNTDDNEHSDSDENDRDATYRHKKFTYRSAPDYGLDLRVGESQSVEMWRPRNSQPVFEENQPAFGHYDRHPQPGPNSQRDFVPPPGVQPRYNLNPFSMANLTQQPYVPQDDGIPGPSHQQQPHPFQGPSPAHRTTSPRHDFSEYNQF